MNYYPFHLGDYAGATRHLSMLEHGAYRLLIDLYYLREGPLPGDLAAVQRLACARTPEERAAVETVLAEFFALTPDGWRNKRCDAEIERFQEKSEKARESAGKRWQSAPNAPAEEAVKPPQCEGNADAMRTHSEGNAIQEPITKNQRKTSWSASLTEPDGFAGFWRAYPRKQAKGAAFKAWQKLAPDPRLTSEILAAIALHRQSAEWQRDGGQFIPHPASWLNARRWEDEGPPGTGANDLGELLVGEAA